MVDHNQKFVKWKLTVLLALIVSSLFFLTPIVDVGAEHDGDKDDYSQERSLVLASDSDNSASGGMREAKSCLAGKWIGKADTPKVGGYGEAVVGTGKSIYVIRSYSTGSSYFWEYDPSNDCWTTLKEWVSDSDLPRPKSGTALAWDSNTLAPSNIYHSAIRCKSSFELKPSDTTTPTKSTFKQMIFPTERSV